LKAGRYYWFANLSDGYLSNSTPTREFISGNLYPSYSINEPDNQTVTANNHIWLNTTAIDETGTLYPGYQNMTVKFYGSNNSDMSSPKLLNTTTNVANNTALAFNWTEAIVEPSYNTTGQVLLMHFNNESPYECYDEETEILTRRELSEEEVYDIITTQPSITLKPISSTSNNLPLKSSTSSKSMDKAFTNLSGSGGWILKTMIPKESTGGYTEVLRKSESLVTSTAPLSLARDKTLLFLIPFDPYSAENSLDCE